MPTPLTPAPRVLSVVRGQPDEAEIAALVVVLGSRAAHATGNATPGREDSGWSAHWRRVGAAPTPGPTAWRLSAR